MLVSCSLVVSETLTCTGGDGFSRGELHYSIYIPGSGQPISTKKRYRPEIFPYLRNLQIILTDPVYSSSSVSDYHGDPVHSAVRSILLRVHKGI